jgi:hypothetical protein
MLLKEEYKMKKFSLFLIISIVYATLFFPFHSYALKKLGQTGCKFLDIAVGARASAMGEAFTLVGNDANALFYNPAGIGRMNTKIDITGSITQWAADIQYNAIGLVINQGIWGNFGLSIIAPDYGDIIGTRVSDTEQGYEETGYLDVGSFAVGVAYARQMTDKFTIGGHVKYVSQHLGSNLLASDEIVENKASGFAYDFGTIFYPGLKSFRLGMSVRNFSPQFKYEETAFQLPLTFNVALAIDILDFWGEHPNNSLVLDVEGVHPRDYDVRIHSGVEYWFKDMLALRVGYKLNYDTEGLTAGVGFKSPEVGGLSLKFDYAYGDLGIFDYVNRFSLGISF